MIVRDSAISGLLSGRFDQLHMCNPVTGMRISEALALRFSDVTSDGLRITNSKFGKSRLLPLHPTADAGLERYLERRRRIGVVDDHLFLSCRGTPLDRKSVGVIFRRIVTKLGLHHAGGRLPRVHDLRHGFAVRVLEGCPPGRASIDRHVLALSTYMGHVNVNSTYWYLRVTPTLLANISDVTSERFAKGEAR